MKANKVKVETIYHLELTEREFITLLSASARVVPSEAMEFAKELNNTKLDAIEFHTLYDELRRIFKE